jgi:hypothetical protein
MTLSAIDETELSRTDFIAKLVKAHPGLTVGGLFDLCTHLSIDEVRLTLYPLVTQGRVVPVKRKSQRAKGPKLVSCYFPPGHDEIKRVVVISSR